MSTVDDSDRASETKLSPIPPSIQFKDKPDDGAPILHNMSITSTSPESYEDGDLRARHPDLDHESEPPMTSRRLVAFTALAFLWTSAQISVFLPAAIAPIIYGDIGGVSYWVWFITANLLGSAAICPFVGALSDLMGRKYVAIIGSLLIIVGQVVCGVAKSMDVFICGMTIAGIGSAINELTALAGTSELAPTSKRGRYVAILVCTFAPFLPCVMWAQLIATQSWRYVPLLICLWTFMGLFLTVFFYNPPRRVNSLGLTAREIIFRIDFVGGFLSIAGIVLLLVGVLSGGYSYTWNDSRVLAPLVVGIVLMMGFVFWEAAGATFPMFPRRLGKAPRTLVLTLIITFISGANFFSVVMLWPSQAYNVYGHDPVGVGLRGLPYAFGVLAGCVISLNLFSVIRGQIRWLLLGASCIMTVGCGALSAATTTNLGAVYFILFVAGLGVGGIVVPASIISTIICPSDLIATITSLTLAIRVIGGAVGYAVYYNVFVAKLVPNVSTLIGGVFYQNGITAPSVIEEAVELTLASLLSPIRSLPGMTDELYQQVVAAGQQGYAESYPWVYYCSIAFGAVSIAASLCLEDISEFMDDRVAVIIV